MVGIEFSERSFEQYHNIELFSEYKLFKVPSQREERGLGYDVEGIVGNFRQFNNRRKKGFTPKYLAQYVFLTLRKWLALSNFHPSSKFAIAFQYKIPSSLKEMDKRHDGFINFCNRLLIKKKNGKYQPKEGIKVYKYKIDHKNHKKILDGEYIMVTSQNALLAKYQLNLLKGEAPRILDIIEDNINDIRGIALYASPMFDTWNEMFKYAKEGHISKKTMYVDPLDLVGHHIYYYTNTGRCGVATSEPKEVWGIPLDEVVEKINSIDSIPTVDLLSYLGEAALKTLYPHDILDILLGLDYIGGLSDETVEFILSVVSLEDLLSSTNSKLVMIFDSSKHDENNNGNNKQLEKEINAYYKEFKHLVTTNEKEYLDDILLFFPL